MRWWGAGGGAQGQASRREDSDAVHREAGTHFALLVPRYSAQVQGLDHRCSCCKEEKTSVRSVTLECPDGSELSHTYTHIESCLCQDTVCGLPQAQQVRTRRSSPRFLGRK
jgi:hypothetical protein